MFIVFFVIIAFISSFSVIILLRPLAVKIDLVDKPSDRKAHIGAVPLIGGFSVYIGLLVTSVLLFMLFPTHFEQPIAEQFITYLWASLLMVITGALDDHSDLSVRSRIVMQVLIASIMMFMAGDVIFSLGNLLSLGELSLGYFAYPFTVIAVLGAINAYNMMDGIDGLIGGISISTFITLSILFFLSGDTDEAIFCLLCVTVLTPYLIHNLQLIVSQDKKIFMGDAGSMFIGFTIVWLLVIGSQPSSLYLTSEKCAFCPVVALWVIALPLMDMAAIMLRRIKRGESPFKADRDHLHHIFMRVGFSSRKTLLIITLLSLILSLVGVVTTIYAVPDWMQLTAFLILFFIYKKALDHVWKLASAYRKAQAYKRLAKRKKIFRLRLK